jgi:mannose-6-phosphate isomerase-like protein (cupin superfamily)
VLLLVMDLSKRAWSGSKRARLFYAEQQRLWIELTRQIRGAFVWHHHKNEGELLLCLSDRLRIQFRDGFVEIGAGEFSVVPTHAIGLQRLGELAGSEI